MEGQGQALVTCNTDVNAEDAQDINYVHESAKRWKEPEKVMAQIAAHVTYCEYAFCDDRRLNRSVCQTFSPIYCSQHWKRRGGRRRHKQSPHIHACLRMPTWPSIPCVVATLKYITAQKLEKGCGCLANLETVSQCAGDSQAWFTTATSETS